MNSKIDFEKLYKENYQAVYYTALQLMGEKYAAEDITQEVFITAFAKYGDLKDINSFQAWVKRIAANKCIDELRKKRPISTEDIETEYAGELEPEENFLQEDYVLNEEKRKTVINIMKSVLSEKQFETVFLYYYDELSMTEIAKLLDIPEGTVLSRLSASRAKIKQGVLEHEKKHNEKLYSIAILPLLALLFKEEAAASSNIPAALPATLQSMAQASGVIAMNTAAENGAVLKEATVKGAVAKNAAIKGTVGKSATGTVIKIGVVGAVAISGTVLVAGALLTGGILLYQNVGNNVRVVSETQQSIETIEKVSVSEEDTESVVAEKPEKELWEILSGTSVSLDGIPIKMGKTTVREIIEEPNTDWEDDIWFRDILSLAPNSESSLELINLYWRSVAAGKDFNTMSKEEKEELYSNGEKFVFVTCNLSEKEVNELDGVIIGFSFVAPECDLSLAPPIDVNGVHFGSDKEEVKKAFGNPKLVKEDGKEWYYEKKDGNFTIRFSEEGVLTEIIYDYDYKESIEE